MEIRAEKTMPFVIDGSDLSQVSTEALKAFTDCAAEDGKIWARWGGRVFAATPKQVPVCQLLPDVEAILKRAILAYRRKLGCKRVLSGWLAPESPQHTSYHIKMVMYWNPFHGSGPAVEYPAR
eukprot:447163-Amphidinium_carterae.2